jgi:hypothetical protein
MHPINRGSWQSPDREVLVKAVYEATPENPFDIDAVAHKLRKTKEAVRNYIKRDANLHARHKECPK